MNEWLTAWVNVYTIELQREIVRHADECVCAAMCCVVAEQWLCTYGHCIEKREYERCLTFSQYKDTNT